MGELLYWEPPGALLGGLGASWAHLGPSWRRSKTTQKQHAKKEQLPDIKKENRPRLWGPIWEAKIDPKSDPKRVQNRGQNRSEKMIEKWTTQSMTTIGTGHARPRGPPGGLGGNQGINPRPEAEDLARQWARYRYARRIFSVIFL